MLFFSPCLGFGYRADGFWFTGSVAGAALEPSVSSAGFVYMLTTARPDAVRCINKAFSEADDQCTTGITRMLAAA
jgi:hypothetical protein